MVQMHYACVVSLAEKGPAPDTNQFQIRSKRRNGATIPMKRVIGAAAAGVVAFSGIYALAASLNVTSNSLGAGTSVVASCTADTLTATYGTLAYSSSVPGYTVTALAIKDNTASPNWLTCNGLAYRVTLYGSGNASLGEVTGTISGIANTQGSSFTTASFSTAVNANLITGVAVVIGG